MMFRGERSVFIADPQKDGMVNIGVGRAGRSEFRVYPFTPSEAITVGLRLADSADPERAATLRHAVLMHLVNSENEEVRRMRADLGGEGISELARSWVIAVLNATFEVSRNG